LKDRFKNAFERFGMQLIGKNRFYLFCDCEGSMLSGFTTTVSLPSSSSSSTTKSSSSGSSASGSSSIKALFEAAGGDWLDVSQAVTLALGLGLGVLEVEAVGFLTLPVPLELDVPAGLGSIASRSFAGDLTVEDFAGDLTVEDFAGDLTVEDFALVVVRALLNLVAANSIEGEDEGSPLGNVSDLVGVFGALSALSEVALAKYSGLLTFLTVEGGGVLTVTGFGGVIASVSEMETTTDAASSISSSSDSIALLLRFAGELTGEMI
jgi:hypothetical protein